jgi:hypothetical protein
MRKLKYLHTAFAAAAMALPCAAVTLPIGAAIAQQMQRLSFTVPAQDATYTEQHIINVPDPPGQGLPRSLLN